MEILKNKKIPCWGIGDSSEEEMGSWILCFFKKANNDNISDYFFYLPGLIVCAFCLMDSTLPEENTSKVLFSVVVVSSLDFLSLILNLFLTEYFNKLLNLYY